MSETVRNKGPWTHRLLIWGCTFALGVLCFWLSGFILDDIGTLPGPDHQELEQTMLDPRLVAEAESLAGQIAEISRSIARETDRQRILRDSTDGAQRTMSQLLEFQRVAIGKGVNPSPEEQKALADSQRIFLDNQQRYQELNQQVAHLEDQRNELDGRQQKTQKRLVEARTPVTAEFERLGEQHRWKIAAIKLSVMLPLLVVAAVFFLKWRATLYAPLIHAFGAAVALQVILVMHEHFPSRYFKYILIGAPLIVVLRMLVYLVRLVAYPKRDWLVRQYRDAYERFLCPVCEYPIRRGPLKYLFWTRRTARKLPQMASTSTAEEPYTCPMCAVKLFEECPTCNAQRHVLLPACEHCGATKSLDEIAAVVGGGDGTPRPATTITE